MNIANRKKVTKIEMGELLPTKYKTGNNMFCRQTKGILEAKLEIVQS